MSLSRLEAFKETIRKSKFPEPPFHLKNWKMYRLALLMMIDALFVSAAYWFSFYLRLESLNFGRFTDIFFRTGPVFLGVCLAAFYLGGMYRQVWRYANFNSAILIVKLVTLGTMFAVAVIYILWPKGFPPRSVLVMFALLSIMSITAQKFSWRAWAAFRVGKGSKSKKRCIIYGAGSAGELAARHAAANPGFPYQIMGFVDDDRNKHGRLLHGLKIFGGAERLKDLAEQKNVTVAILAIHTASGKVVRNLVELCVAAGVEPLIMHDMVNTLGRNIVQPRKIDVKDLLRRSPASVDKPLLTQFFNDKVVLVTGAGGSIGSEICRQIRDYKPRKLIILDQSEYNLFKIDQELNETEGPMEIVQALGSAGNASFVAKVFQKYRPDVVLHAAAYKHVPLLENNINEGIINNIKATDVLCKAAIKYKTSSFLLVSSDKAVRPKSIMGATKRCCELIVQAVAQARDHKVKFCSVRFGNVLGSSGSVVPTFMEQIQKGGPITVTDKEITRFFMLIEEAVGLVLQSAAMAQGGETFVLNMGDPVNIYDMARHLIILAGKQPDKDIEIQITGLRAGEKLYEELILEGSEDHTLHRDVFIAKSRDIDSLQLSAQVTHLLETAERDLPEACRKVLFSIIGSEQPTGDTPSAPVQPVVH